MEKPPVVVKIIIKSFVYLSVAVLAIAVVVIYKTIAAPSRSPFGVNFFESDRYQFQANLETAFEPKPGFSGINDLAAPTDITYDRLGARVDSPGIETGNTVYMMTIGCSQGFGHGVRNSQTFTSILGVLLGKPVANFSVSGYGGVSALLRLRQRVNLKPKVIVYAFWEDHFNRNVNHCFTTGSPVCFEAPTIQFDAESHPYIQFPSNTTHNLELTRRWYLEASSKSDKYRTFVTDLYWSSYSVWRSIEKEYRRITGQPEEPPEENKVAAANFVIDQMKLTADQIGAQLVVIYIPIYFDGTMRQVPQDMRISAERKGIIFIDMTKRLQTLREAAVPLAIHGDGHMTAAVHRAITDEVLNYIQRREVGKSNLE